MRERQSQRKEGIKMEKGVKETENYEKMKDFRNEILKERKKERNERKYICSSDKCAMWRF